MEKQTEVTLAKQQTAEQQSHARHVSAELQSQLEAERETRENLEKDASERRSSIKRNSSSMFRTAVLILLFVVVDVILTRIKPWV